MNKKKKNDEKSIVKMIIPLIIIIAVIICAIFALKSKVMEDLFYGKDLSADVFDPKEDVLSSEPEEGDAEVTTVSPQEAFEAYELTALDPLVTKFASNYYLRKDGFAWPGFAGGVDGTLSKEVRDFDKDGQVEMLTIDLVKAELTGETKGMAEGFEGDISKLVFNMYECKDGNVTLAATKDTFIDFLGGFDGRRFTCYLKESDKTVYIAQNADGFYHFVADGANPSIEILHYDGTDFVSDFSESFSGSEFSQQQEKASSIKSSLAGLGFMKTAENLKVETMLLDKADNLESVLYMYTENSTDPAKIDNKKPETFGEVVYKFSPVIPDDITEKDIVNYAEETKKKEEEAKKAEEQKKAEETKVYNDSVLGDSSSKKYTADELSNLSVDQLKLARNEIYARHGRKFNDKSLQEYFNKQSWYKGTIEPGAFTDSMLNATERANIKTMKEVEAAKTSGSSTSEAAPSKPNNSYVMPEAASRVHSAEELAGFSKEQLRLARNEIYARHGYKFKDKNLQAYFDSQQWYSGTTTEVPYNSLSDIEKENLALIKSLE